MDMAEIVNYLNKNIKKSLENDVKPLVASSKVPENGGLFASLREIFAYIDYFGFLYTGTNISKSAVRFTRDYLGRVDSRYAEVGGLLYHVYRHGTIHQYEPKRIQMANGTQLAWMIKKGGTAETHLSGYIKGSVIWLQIHLDSLYYHLIKAIDFYVIDLQKKPNLRVNFEKARKEIETPETEVAVKKSKIIANSDFNFIVNLISKIKSPGFGTP